MEQPPPVNVSTALPLASPTSSTGAFPPAAAAMKHIRTGSRMGESRTSDDEVARTAVKVGT